MSSSEKFLREFSILSDAGIAVIAVETSEPSRLQSIMSRFCLKNRIKFNYWTTREGWIPMNAMESSEIRIVYDRASAPTPDKFSNALGALFNPDRKDSINFCVNPYFEIAKGGEAINAFVIQSMKDLANFLSADKTRLVFTIKEGFSIPDELKDDVVVIKLERPSLEEITYIYEDLVNNINDVELNPHFSKEQVEQIAASCKGMTSTDLVNSISRCISDLAEENTSLRKQKPFDKFITKIHEFKTEIIRNSSALQLLPTTTFDMIGGLDNLKRWMKITKRCFSPEARAFGIDRPKGLLLTGVMGTGKTLIGKAIAGELNRPFILFDIQAVFDKYVGGTEGKIKAALSIIESMAPNVTLIDEIATSLSSSGVSDGGVTGRVISTILTWLQELNEDVFVIFTANDVTNLPPQLTRRGRLDGIFGFGFPNEEERLEIFKIHLKKRGHYKEGMNLTYSVQKSDRYVSAEIEAAVSDALKEAFVTGVEITDKLIASQFNRIIPVSRSYADKVAAMEDWAKKNAIPASYEKPLVEAISEEKRQISRSKK